MTAALDWPVAHGGAAVVTRDDLQQLWVPGTGPETTWAIASVTKLLTTMATLAACDAGHVDLDQPVDEEGATVRHLLARGTPVVSAELFAEATTVQFPGLAGLVPGVGRFDPCDWGLGFELLDGKRPHWMGERRSPAAFGHFGASGCFLWVDPEVEVAAVGVSDRDFEDGRWAMRTWPAWSDGLRSARDTL